MEIAYTFAKYFPEFPFKHSFIKRIVEKRYNNANDRPILYVGLRYSRLLSFEIVATFIYRLCYY